MVGWFERLEVKWANRRGSLCMKFAQLQAKQKEIAHTHTQSLILLTGFIPFFFSSTRSFSFSARLLMRKLPKGTWKNLRKFCSKAGIFLKIFLYIYEKISFKKDLKFYQTKLRKQLESFCLKYKVYFSYYIFYRVYFLTRNFLCAFIHLSFRKPIF